MSKAKVSWLLCIGRLVSKTDNVLHFARLVKQACVDLVSDLFVYYRFGYEPFVCSLGLQTGNYFQQNDLTLGQVSGLINYDKMQMKVIIEVNELCYHSCMVR